MWKFTFWISIILFSLSGSIYPSSLWDHKQPSLYSSAKSSRVGDIVTIFISESTSAAQEADTKTSKESSIGGQFMDLWDQVSQDVGRDEQLRKTKEYSIGGEDRYVGAGRTSRSSRVDAVVTAVVTEILENGNLYLVGEHKVKVNEETETIRISGIVRPADISPDNTVFSHQIAQAEVAVMGQGVVGSKQTPGILTKVFNWFF